MDRLITSARDRQSLLSTHKVLRNTYFMLSLTLAFSAITATASTVFALPSPGLILTLVGMYGLMFLTYRLADKPSGILAAFAFTGFLGYILGPMLNAYLSAGMGDVIALALGGTALVFFCCSAYVLTTRKDMSFLGGMLMAGVVVVLIGMVATSSCSFLRCTWRLVPCLFCFLRAPSCLKPAISSTAAKPTTFARPSACMCRSTTSS